MIPASDFHGEVVGGSSHLPPPWPAAADSGCSSEPDSAGCWSGTAETTKRFVFCKSRITHHVCGCCLGILPLILPPWRSSKALWMWSCAACSGCSAWAEFGPGGLQRSLPTLTILSACSNCPLWVWILSPHCEDADVKKSQLVPGFSASWWASCEKWVEILFHLVRRRKIYLELHVCPVEDFSMMMVLSFSKLYCLHELCLFGYYLHWVCHLEVSYPDFKKYIYHKFMEFD